MKKALITLLCALIFSVFGSAAALADSMLLEYDGSVHEYNDAIYALVVNNHEITPPLSPIIFNDRALVPVREIFEEIGATVEYNSENESVRIYNDDTVVLLFINDNTAYINGRRVAIPDNVVPKLISKLGGETKTMVPVRFISESMGMPVDFDADAGAILIASDGYDYTPAGPEPAAAPKPYVTDLAYRVTGSDELTIDITSDNPLENVDSFTMDSPGRLVIDLNGAGLAIGESTKTVNNAGVTTIRLGDNGDRARIVVDSEYISSYNVETVSDTQVHAVIKTNAPANTPQPAARPQTNAFVPTVDVSSGTPSTEAPSAAETTFNRADNSTKLVVLDAGHGGSDSGAVGTLNGEAVLEKDLTLSLTYKVKALLEQNGVTVSLTRTGDTLPSLVERPTQANGENAAIFVSIHINSADPSTAHGIETYYAEENNGDEYGTTSSRLASALLRHMIAETDAADRGVRIAEHAVTRRCNMPASLVECGFISNPDEVALMSSEDYQNRLARGIADGILETLPTVTIPG